jgi:hypothetical protein
VIDVTDTKAPTPSLVISQPSLWEPNHKMELVATAGGSDSCDAHPTIEIVVTSNEPANAAGDGSTETDSKVVARPDGLFDVYVRAERSGAGKGRLYTISVRASDASGNTTTNTGTVAVPKSRK